MTPTITQADREAAACLAALAEFRPMLLSGSHDDHPYIQTFAAHRKAVELAGVRIGLDAAKQEIIMQSCGCYRRIDQIDPAEVLARHGGVFPSARKNLP